MKKSFAALFFAFHLAPALQVWIPQIAPPCATCESTGHENCASEGHGCSHSAAQPAQPSCHAKVPEPVVPQADCCDAETPASEAAQKPSEQQIGHKCPASTFNLIVNSDTRALCPHFEGIAHSTFFVSSRFPKNVRRSYLSDRGIDRPPSA